MIEFFRSDLLSSSLVASHCTERLSKGNYFANEVEVRRVGVLVLLVCFKTLISSNRSQLELGLDWFRVFGLDLIVLF